MDLDAQRLLPCVFASNLPLLVMYIPCSDRLLAVSVCTVMAGSDLHLMSILEEGFPGITYVHKQCVSLSG